ncbi:DUF2267 domain-containing protein [Streptomyces sp. HC307]|uniref:DUF2267 domain-containing protein n=1 Tax=Streptomyces flavusporus TaxID=3385496 RepID=UPI0039173ABF
MPKVPWRVGRVVNIRASHLALARIGQTDGRSGSVLGRIRGVRVSALLRPLLRQAIDRPAPPLPRLRRTAAALPTSLAENLAAQLPPEVGEHLRRVASAPDVPQTGVRMSRREFFDRVAQRAGADYPKAVYEARCVIEVVERQPRDR